MREVSDATLKKETLLLGLTHSEFLPVIGLSILVPTLPFVLKNLTLFEINEFAFAKVMLPILWFSFFIYFRLLREVKGVSGLASDVLKSLILLLVVSPVVVVVAVFSIAIQIPI